MRYLLAPRGTRELRSWSGKKTLFAFDFDGTLSPIVTRAALAKMAPSTEALLRELSRRVPVAIVSGRSVRDLGTKIPFAVKYLIGNHGAEGVPGHAREARKASRVASLWKKQLKALAAETPLPRGAELEDKGYTLALHYRKCGDSRSARRKLLALADRLSPSARLVGGKAVINLIPEGVMNKGTALEELRKCSGFDTVFYIGDDDTDEDVFSLKSKAILTVRVGRRRSSHARYFIRTQAEIDRVLESLLEISLAKPR